jgi:hypothetical protein
MADNFEVVFEKQVESGRTTNQNRPRIFKLTVIFYNFFLPLPSIAEANCRRQSAMVKTTKLPRQRQRQRQNYIFKEKTLLIFLNLIYFLFRMKMYFKKTSMLNFLGDKRFRTFVLMLEQTEKTRSTRVDVAWILFNDL